MEDRIRIWKEVHDGLMDSIHHKLRVHHIGSNMIKLYFQDHYTFIVELLKNEGYSDDEIESIEKLLNVKFIDSFKDRIYVFKNEAWYDRWKSEVVR